METRVNVCGVTLYMCRWFVTYAFMFSASVYMLGDTCTARRPLVMELEEGTKVTFDTKGKVYCFWKNPRVGQHRAIFKGGREVTLQQGRAYVWTDPRGAVEGMVLCGGDIDFRALRSRLQRTIDQL